MWVATRRPLSPHLFVIGTEKLSQLITYCVELGYWKAVKISKNGPLISHVFFVEDLILFTESSSSSIRVMKKCIERFSSVLGQKVKFEKSYLFVSKNVGSQVARNLARLCAFPLTSNLGKYLRVPLIHERTNKETYNNLIEKVTKRLDFWKSRLLSYNGRLTLIKSVSSSILIYTI